MLTLLTIAVLAQPLSAPPLVPVAAPTPAAPTAATSVTGVVHPSPNTSLVAGGVASLVTGLSAAFFAPAAVAGRFDSTRAILGALNLIPGMPVLGLLFDGLSLASRGKGLFGDSREAPMRGVLMNSLALLAQGAGVGLLAAAQSRPAPSGVALTGLHVGQDTLGLAGTF